MKWSKVQNIIGFLSSPQVSYIPVQSPSLESCFEILGETIKTHRHEKEKEYFSHLGCILK